MRLPLKTPCLAVSVCFVGLLGGCAAGSPLTSAVAPALVLGEHVAYRVVNQSSATRRITRPMLRARPTGQRLYSSLHADSERPGPPQVSSGQYRRQGVVWVPSYAGLSVLHIGAKSSGSANPAADPLARDPGAEDLTLPRYLAAAMARAPAGHHVPEHAQLSWLSAPKPGQALRQGEITNTLNVRLRSLIPPHVLAQVRDQWRYRLNIEVLTNLRQTDIRWRVMHYDEHGVTETERGGRWE